MGFFKNINQDSAINKGNTKGKVIAIFFRIASYCYTHQLLSILCFPYLLFYKYIIQVFFSLELPYETRIGKGLKIYHGIALVVHENTLIGKNCVMRQSTTIGNAWPDGKCPIIGDNVEIGCNVCIIGNVIIGDNVIIGAGSVIVKDIPANSVVVGNPSRIIKVRPPLSI